MTTPDRPTDTPDAAAERLKHDFHEDENSPLLQPEEDDRIRDDVLLVVAELERLRAAGTPDAGAVAAAERLRSLDNWLYNGLDNFPDGLTESSLVTDARTVARELLRLASTLEKP